MTTQAAADERSSGPLPQGRRCSSASLPEPRQRADVAAHERILTVAPFWR